MPAPQIRTSSSSPSPSNVHVRKGEEGHGWGCDNRIVTWGRRGAMEKADGRTLHALVGTLHHAEREG